MQVLKHKVTDELCFLINIHGMNVSVDYPNSRVAIFVIMDESSSWIFVSENYDEFVSTYIPILPDEQDDYPELEQMRIDASNFVISNLDRSVRKPLRVGEVETRLNTEIPDEYPELEQVSVVDNTKYYSNTQCLIISISIIIIQILNIIMWLVEPPKFTDEPESLLIVGLVKSCIGIVSIIPNLLLLSADVPGKWKSVFWNCRLLLTLEILFYVIAIIVFFAAIPRESLSFLSNLSFYK